ncbi:hypothetical protein CGCA056_v014857 [Colletotrichum aenigma]|uniref:uncharacterized protein n=1 Tax=Colletotrichum aenigma TaxID=1215731 RepID=UPI0018731577|nr:uncharacterized protein CGCA056_v014857 [Colletotrichum aenigma]KAF5502732.1 hypothetical protein CGCA056_v014857 [Colletotrichum aenigma]
MSAFRPLLSQTGRMATRSISVKITITSETANRRRADLFLGDVNCLLVPLFMAENIPQHS